MKFTARRQLAKVEASSLNVAVVLAQGRAIVASGSPQQDVELDGTTYAVSQANNM